MLQLRPKLLIAAASAAALTAPTASATPPSFGAPVNEYFYAAVQGVQRTVWREPTTVHGDCAETVTMIPQGSETVTLTAKRQLVLVQQIGGVVSMRVGTWDPYQFNTGGWTVPGATVRRDNTRTITSPGNCAGNGLPTPPLVKEDCGKRSRRWDLTLGFEPANLHVRMESYPAATQPHTRAYAPYNNCPIQTTGNLAIPDSIAELDVAVPKTALFGSYGPHRFGGFRRWYHAGGGASVSTTVTWTITLTRIHHP
ncbi:MAG: hypothetical protein JOY89_26850 [Solirubrobacterales bacterium]|nr:hypothetical protein [Solirubrobacterales bacterium]